MRDLVDECGEAAHWCGNGGNGAPHELNPGVATMNLKQSLEDARQSSVQSTQPIVVWIDEDGSDHIAGYAEYLESVRPGSHWLATFERGRRWGEPQ